MKLTQAQIGRLRQLSEDEAVAEIARIMEAERETRRIAAQRYREKNREKVLAEKREYRKTHKPQIAAYKRQRRQLGAEGPRKRSAESIQVLKEWRLRNADKVREYARRNRSREKAIKLLRSEPDEVLRIIRAQIPSYLDRQARADIVAEACAAIVGRRVLFEDLKTCAKPFVAAYNRMFDRFKTLSLDAPVPGMNGATYLDRLAEEHAT